MSNDKKDSQSVGLLGFMFLIFMTLKLTGFINWSWWWVTLPLWGGFLMMFCVLLIGIIVHLFKK